MDISASDLSHQQLYKLMTGTIVPRPIGWISTLGRDGHRNLAPFSFFNGVSPDPPTVMFASGRHPDRPKDTLRNVLETGEFVVNLVTEALAAAMNRSAVVAPPDFDEFDFAGVTAAPAKTVRAPRVAESPVHFECVVTFVHEVGSYSVVFGGVKHLHVADELLLENLRVDTAKLRPIGRLAGPNYAFVRETFATERPLYEGNEGG